MESLIFIVLSIFIIYSLMQLSISLQQFLLTDTRCVRSFVIVALSGQLPDIEFIVRKNLLKYRDDEKTKIMFVDMGLDKETKLICQKLCSHHAGVLFCPSNKVLYNLETALGV